MTRFQRACLWLGIVMLLAAGDTALAWFLARRGIGPLARFLIVAGVPVLCLIGVNLSIPTRCISCRLPLGFLRRIGEMLRGSGSTPRCAACRASRV